MDKDCTRVYLIRHGEVEDAYPKKYNGQRDIPLSPNGFAQMEELAERLKDRPLTAVYCSDLARTYKGAEVLAREKKLPVYQRPLLREKNFGVWEGLTHEEASGKYPAEWRQWLQDPGGSRPPEGETYREVQERVMKEFPRILEKHRGEEITVLAHGGVNRVILCHALRLDIKNIFRIEQKFAALNIIDFFKDDMAYVHLMNG